MEPLDPKLARLVHEGMVEAVPGPEVEARVLRGLLAQLPGPSGPGGGSEGGRLGEGLAAGSGPASPVAAASGAKAWLWAAALGVTVIGGAWVAGRSPTPTPAERQVTALGPAKATAGDGARRERSEAAARLEPARADAEPEPARADAEPRRADAEPARADAEPARADAEPDDARSGRPAGAAPTAAIDPDPRASPSRARPPRGSAAPTAAGSASPDAPPSEPADGLADEISRIAAADAALERGDPEEALRLARAHALAHPRGQLDVERMAIERAARCALGRPGAVEAAAAFLRAHGRTPAAAKVRARCPGPSAREREVQAE